MRFVLLLCFTLLYGKYYSIQVFSSKNINDTLKVYQDIRNYSFARVEHIKKYYTVRVGLSNKLKNLKPVLKKIHLKYRDAFLRDVKFLQKRIIVCNCKKYNHKQYLIFDLIKQKIPWEVNLTKLKRIKTVSDIKFSPYIKFSMALLENNKEELKKTVNNKSLPYKDKVEAYVKLGMINKASCQINKNLKSSSLDYQVYQQAVNFYTVYANRFKFKSFLQRSDKIDTLNNEFSTKFYNKGIKLNQNILLKNGNKLYKNLKNLYSLNFFVKYKKLKTNINFNKFYKNFIGVKFDWYIKNSDIQFALNQKSDESIYMLYGGRKNFINFIYNYYLDNRNYFSSNLKYNIFYTQKSNYIGQGENFNIRYTDNLRVGYPDFSYYLFFNQGVYKESNKADSLMKNFSNVSNFDVLPDKFYIIGNGLSFGMNNLDTLSPGFLPFGDVSLNYEILKRNFGYNLLFGLRRRIFFKDNLMIGVNYSKALNKADTNPFIKFLLRYYYWF